MHESEYNLSLLNEILPPLILKSFRRYLGTFKFERGPCKKGKALLKELIPSYRSSDHSIFIHPGMTGVA